MLFVDFSKDQDAFEAKYKNVATLYKGKGISFLLGDVESAQNAFQVVIFSICMYQCFTLNAFEFISFDTMVFLYLCMAVLWT